MAHGQRGTAVAAAGTLAVLLLSAPSPRAALRLLADAGVSAYPTAPLVAAAALLAWVIAGWLALTVLVVLLSRVPGLLGRTARGLAGRVAPATVRRAVEAALGITVAVGVVTPTAALAAPTSLPTAAATTETAWDLDWPSSTTTPDTSTSSTAAQPPVATTSPAPTVTTAPRRPAASPPPSAASTVPRTRAAAPPSVVRPSPATPVATSVVVGPGDTLWSLAEASLRSTGTPPTDRQVAQAWPRWWAANREAVGDDPDLLLPGTVLRPPAG